MLRLLIKVGANVDIPSQHRRTAASSISIILGIADVLKYFIELGAYTSPIVKVLACIYYLKENWIN